jgi:hypothetical protein
MKGRIMKKYFYIFLFIALLPVLVEAQYYTQSFETCDSNSLPSGWYSKNNLPVVPLYPYANWTVRDSGLMLPGINFSPGRGQRSYDGLKALGVTWWSMYDTSGNYENNADGWLITKQFTNIPSDGYFSFYACGGSPSWVDSIQVWVSTTDSTIPSFTHYLGTELFTGSAFGAFRFCFYELSAYAHQNIRIGFRYVSDYTNGFCAMMDYFQMYGTVGVSQIGTNVPNKFALSQNYPNPFNPVTKIKFDIAKATNVKLEVYNNLGQVVKTLINEQKSAGYYETDFNASSLPSGVYFYRLTTDQFTDIKKMVVVK